MEVVTELRLQETVHIEMDRLARLADEIGVTGAEGAESASVEEIVERLCAAETAWQAGEFTRLADISRALARVSEDVGMETLSQVARNVVRAAAGRDAVALAALVARQSRAGEASLAAIWSLGSKRV